LGTKIGVVVFAAVGVLGLYLAGTPGLYAAVARMVLGAFVVGVATRCVKWGCASDPFREEVALGS
jgi:hypothetical protein